MTSKANWFFAAAAVAGKAVVMGLNNHGAVRSGAFAFGIPAQWLLPGSC